MDPEQRTELRELVREIPDFPREGIGFKDITPLLADPGALQAAVHGLAEYARPLNVDCVIAAEARGFLLGPALALELGAGFVLARKPGKLPYRDGQRRVPARVRLGRARAAHRRAGRGQAGARARRSARHGRHRAGAVRAGRGAGGEVVGCGFLIELEFLGGRARLRPHEAHALISYES